MMQDKLLVVTLNVERLGLGEMYPQPPSWFFSGTCIEHGVYLVYAYLSIILHPDLVTNIVYKSILTQM